MKRLLFVLLLLPYSSYAQDWRIGLSGGVSIITKPRQAPPEYNDSKLMPGAVGMLFISRDISDRLDFGLDVAAVNLVRSADIKLYSPSGPIGTKSDARLHIGKFALMFTPSLSYTAGNSYFGPQLGYFITTKGSNKANFFGTAEQHFYYDKVRGLVVGAHAGYRRRLSKRLSLTGELRGNYLRGNQKANGVSAYGFNMLQVQLTAGLSYW